MPFPLVFLPLVAQLDGTFSSSNPSSLPIEIIEKKEKEAREKQQQQQQQVYSQPAGPVSRKGCMDLVQADPEGSVDIAKAALLQAMGRERVRAGLCLGAALTALGRFDEARDAFVGARDTADAGDHISRARLGDMAANAELAQGKGAPALLLLGTALTDAKAVQALQGTQDSGGNALVAEVQVDRARALVMVDQPEEAATALIAARDADPANAQAWLLSATLSRRQNQLIAASTQIQQAAKLAPQDPAVGLEAGVIAMLSKDTASARRSWQSVVDVAPDSPEAATARTYLEETAPDDAPVPAPASPAPTPSPTKPKS